MSDDSLTIAEFCAAEKMSRTTLYALWATGVGPRYFRVNSSRRISAEARAEWRRAREAEAMAEQVAA